MRCIPKIIQDPAGIQTLRLHHYWTRIEQYYKDVKIPRRELHERRKYSDDEIKIVKDSMAEEDLAILQFVPALRKRMGYDR